MPLPKPVSRPLPSLPRGLPVNRLALALLLGVPAVADVIPSYEELRPYALFGDWERNLLAYADDPASHFLPRSGGMRPEPIVARMQKAAAIMQFKLEGQVIARNPHWGLDNRRLLHAIDRAAGTISVDGRRYPLRDTHFPTLDPADPYRL